MTGTSAVRVYTLDPAGNYGDTITWNGKVGGWTKDGATKISDGTVVITDGMGFAVYNGLKVKDGEESTARGSVASEAIFLVSGQVDLICKNTVPEGYSVNGNSTPVEIDINQITPETPAGVTLTGTSALRIYTLDTAGNYGDTITWNGKVGGWTKDGTNKLSDGVVTFKPGEGFAVYNGLKVKDGEESTARGSVASPAVLKLPSPIK